MAKKYVIVRYTAELKYKPEPGDIRNDGEMYPEWEEYESLDEAQQAVENHPARYINRIEEKHGTAGIYYECDEYAIEEWEIDESGEMVDSSLCALMWYRPEKLRHVNISVEVV